ncbi:putative INT1 protein/putative bud site selection protein BUD4 [Golovinomyces cichoracearum]|uniref:Putative INT1 protein/putative bud site selection protein BUD4 n=1 Tax=Golovinomyces cichoracearum TaxID=62708 RepID=A0A420IHZ7_9PEZI|nr:putative INT1 protein/putative bud site selection protein BUD4 [Golovinomyces cichoracearum]
MEPSSTRALLELSTSSSKRNSPSMSRATNKNFHNPDSSPFQSSPLNSSIDGKSSPRLFWLGRDPATPTRFNIENYSTGREFSPSPTRRSSIEKLQKASRVKNSNMFAREQKLEYDPTSIPIIERPLIKTIQGNAYNGSGLDGYRMNERPFPLSHQRKGSKDIKDNPSSTPTHALDSNLAKTISKLGLNSVNSPSRDQTSPTKSSLSNTRPKSSFDSEFGIRPEDLSFDERKLPPGKKLHRHAKSVTFDSGPPQVNEYEMATPDLSSVGTESRENSYDSMEDQYDHLSHDDSMEQENSFDASLEDIAKTPVVGPEDWPNEGVNKDSDIFMSGEIEDPFSELTDDSKQDREPTKTLTWSRRNSQALSNTNGEQRPLPPLPRDLNINKRSNSFSSDYSNVADSSRNASKYQSYSHENPVAETETQRFDGAKLTLEERLNLMMNQDDEIPNQIENQRDRRMRRAVRSSHTPERRQFTSILEDEDSLDEFSSPVSYHLPSRISRESILRKIHGHSTTRESDYIYSSPKYDLSPDHRMLPDPDIPLPTTETDYDVDVNSGEDGDNDNDECDEKAITELESDDESDTTIFDIPELSLQIPIKPDEGDSNISHETQESESHYSDDQNIELSNIEPNDTENDGEKQKSPELNENSDVPKSSLDLKSCDEPEETHDSGLDVSKFRRSLLTESISNHERDSDPHTDSNTDALSPSPISERPIAENSRPCTPEDQLYGYCPEEEEDFEIGTPESVIHHKICSPSSSESSSISDHTATIKSASGSEKLKTRPSATPGELDELREKRETFNGEIPSIPPIPDRHRDRPMSVDRGMMQKFEENFVKTPVFKRSLTLDIGNDISLNLENDFERVLQAQKRGYLTRQNTKIVVATSDTGLHNKYHDTGAVDDSLSRSNRAKSWTVEPWNGQRRKSSGQRSSARSQNSSSMTKKLESKRTASGMSKASIDTMPEEGVERGRLFVKVLGVKDLNLPLPRNEKTWFNLTLDNGVHCVTTTWLELGKNAPIGQEFELIVPNDLEFQLTLSVKLIKPPPKKIVETFNRGFKVHKPSTFSRVFTSPKKRKELEARQRLEDQRNAKQKELELISKRVSMEPTAWDILSPYSSEDGKFGRSYICLKDHESRCFGRPCVAEVSCFNEWANEQVSNSSSIMSKRSSTQIQRRPPYKVAQLELQLLFVPRPKGVSDDEMPKSMNSCIREMREAEKALETHWEGHLSQLGGDCPYWRRRYFKLVGSRLTAYHESTRQPRVTINLGNACKLIDDRTLLTQKETTCKGGKRRKSGFAEEEEGYMFVEEGFRIRFNNGEMIDFYAHDPAEKEAWMKALEGCIGKEGEAGKRSWCNIVFKHEQRLRKRGERSQA